MSANGSPAVSRHEDLTDRVFDHLTVVALWGRSPDSERYWLCRCDCLAGDDVVRTTTQLTHGHLHPLRLMCAVCRRRVLAQRPTPVAKHDAGYRRGFREQWRRTGSLWSPGQTERLAAAVRAALVAAFGPTNETYRGPFTIEADDAEPCVEGSADVCTATDTAAPRCHTLEEVAAEMGVSRERVRQIEAAALRKFAVRLFVACPAAFDYQHPDLSKIRGAPYAASHRHRAAKRYQRKLARKAAPVAHSEAA